MNERGGIFELQENPEREQRYQRYYGKANPSLITKIMLSLQDDPRETREWYKKHLGQASENAALRKIQTSLPVKDEGASATVTRNQQYWHQKAQLEVAPKVGTAAYFLKQYSE
mmetsp:Transcript_24365/g.62241  ORF Transcript_24365/g.62241 Transcript_24365/m.62241 type:complete len:113 (-) Transcript_24365:1124-1462(-)